MAASTGSNIRVGTVYSGPCKRGLVRLRSRAARCGGSRSSWIGHLLGRTRRHTRRGPANRSPLRFRTGAALTSRRYDHLWCRIGQRLPWVAAQGISTHWLRHTALTWVERHFSYATARVYAGHTDSTGPATTTYIKADLQAVASALAVMTGQPHPLAVRVEHPDRLFRGTRL